jgi:DNA-binding PucR family transcriptional regulator
VQEDELGYPLHGEHLAFVAWGREPDRVAPAVAATLQGQAITVPGTGGAVWGWICAPRISSMQGLPAQAACVKLPSETFLSLGQLGSGADGFRRSHREAVRAFRIGATIGQTITVYSDVQLEALALADERFAIDFTETELSTLAGKDARSRVLRDTLRAYFKTGHNGAAAAASLGVHERTVSYRLTTIEKVLGHTVIDRRDELGVALRLHALLERRSDTAQNL